MCGTHARVLCPEAACTCRHKYLPYIPQKAACTLKPLKCRLLFCSRRYRLFNNDPCIQRLYRAVVVRTDGAGEFLRLRLVDVVISKRSLCRVCGFATHAVPNPNQPRAYLRHTHYASPTTINAASVGWVLTQQNLPC